MDDLKFNKVAAGFLMAALIAMGGYKISEILVPHQKLAENSYPVEIKQQVATSDAVMPAGPEPILAMLADASREEQEILSHLKRLIDLKLISSDIRSRFSESSTNKNLYKLKLPGCRPVSIFVMPISCF